MRYATRTSFVFAIGFALASLVASTAHAEPPAPPPRAATGQTPDLVKTRDGGWIRGTILEMAPGKSVTIETATGEVRTLPAESVIYAGPDQRVEPGPPPADPRPTIVASPGVSITINGQSIRTEPLAPVAFETAQPNVPVMVKVGDGIRESFEPTTGDSYRRSASRVEYFDALCVAPCTTSMTKGTHTLALRRADGLIASSPDPVRIDGPSKVRGDFVSRSGMRTAGWLVGAAALGGGGAAIGIGASQDQTALVAGGGVLAGLGLTAAIFMVLKQDEATFTITPIAPASLLAPAAGRLEAAPGAPQIGQGLTVTGTF